MLSQLYYAQVNYIILGINSNNYSQINYSTFAGGSLFRIHAKRNTSKHNIRQFSVKM